MDEWDVLKAHARARCVTAADRLWCEVALALGDAAREMERVFGPVTPDGYFTRTAKDYAAIRKAAADAEMARRAKASAERKTANAAKRAAREERKRMRRAYSARRHPGPSDLYADMRHARDQMRRAVATLRSTRDGLPGAVAAHDRASGERLIAVARDDVRRWELRYAIACAAAGAVPGGRGTK